MAKTEETPLKNRTQLGDPVSLKAETSRTSPTEHDRPHASPHTSTGEKKQESLAELAKRKAETNPTQLGDPISLKAETSTREPTEQDRGAKSDEEAVKYDREADQKVKRGSKL
ncbi:MAG: hypothetical protein M1821_006226 [Bathelium mastoideum]|nr:MAG: hypothetical protein M1821_006226 [Bathelium mastoideum]KAI9686565.1 MAG: hypothetical protein M1822_003576 [Bathelium mastoideum]